VQPGSPEPHLATALGSRALPLAAQPSSALPVGPRGEEGALSVEEVPEDGVAAELHNAKIIE